MAELTVLWCWARAAWERGRAARSESGQITVETVIWSAIAVVAVGTIAGILYAKFRDKASNIDTKTPALP